MKTKQFLKYTAIAFAGSVLLSACSSNVAETAAPADKKETAKPAAAKPLTDKEKRALADKEADALTKQFEAAVKEKEMAKLKPLRDQVFALDCNFNKKLHIAQRYAWVLFYAKDKAGARAAWEDYAALDPKDIKLRAAADIRIADTYWGDKKNVALFEKLLRDVMNNKDYPQSFRVDAASQLINKVLRPKRTADIRQVIATVKAMGEQPFHVQTALLRFEAESYLEDEMFEKVISCHDDFLKANPKLTDAQKIAILMQKAEMYRRLAQPENAIPLYLEIGLSPVKHGQRQAAAHFYFECMKSENRAKEALDNTAKILFFDPPSTNLHFRQIPYNTMISYCIQAKDYKKAEFYADEAAKALAQEEKRVQWAKMRKFDAVFAAQDLKRAKALLDAELKAGNPGAIEAAGRYALLQFQRNNFKEAAAYYKQIPGSSYVKGNWVDTQYMVPQVTCIARVSKADAAVKADEMAANMKFSKADRARFAMMSALLKDPANYKNLVKIAKEYGLNDEQTASVIALAGKFAVSLNENDLAEKIYAERQKLFAPAKRNQLTIRYVKNAPTDVGAWLNSPLLKDPANRADVTNQYGEKEAANLVTDVMAAGRNVGSSDVQADKETYFYVCYDEYGLHLFFVGVDSKVKDVMAGRLGGSGYEMYIALGENAPSYQWLFSQPESKFDVVPPWNSPHEYYRHFGNFVDITSRPIENGIATAMNFSWELAYDRLPKNGDLWPFEIIRWTRGGGVTWGGKSVWQIGNWGRLKFDGMTPEVLREIRKIIIYKALARYNRQKSAHAGGKIAIAKDAELGDPEFYEKALKPEVDRLDELAKLVTDDMDDATIEKLWVEAVPAWFDFQYKADKIRTQYLRQRFIETGK